MSNATNSLARSYHTLVGVVMLVLALIGFGQFYFHGMAYPGRPLTPPIRTLVIVHSAFMTAWLLLMVLQPFLILRGSRKTHMTVGRFGALISVAILISGLMLALGSARNTPAEVKIWGLAPLHFMVVPFVGILVFAGFVALGIKNRSNPPMHRAMMLLGTLSALSAAVSRIDPLNSLYLGTAWELAFGPFFMTLVFGVLLIVVHTVITRSVDRYFAIGMVVLIALSAGIWRLGTTELWARIATALV